MIGADQHEYTKEHDYCAANQLLAKEATVPVEVSDDEQFDQITDVTNLRELIEAMSVPSLTKSPTPILAGGLLSHAEDENFNETGFRGFDNGHLSCGDAQAAGSPELPTLDGPYETKVPPRQPIKEFVCHSCSKTYQSFGALQRHLKFECNINQKFKCPLPECKYKSAVVSSVIKHVSAMHPQIHRSSLYRSADSETAQRAGRPSLFMRQNLLREKEPGIYHYQYQVIMKSSIARSSEKSLKMLPSEDASTLQPFICPFCSKSYTLIKNLRRHMSVECQKEKRFKCHLCANSYYYRTDLRNHMHRVHDIIAGFKSQVRMHEMRQKLQKKNPPEQPCAVSALHSLYFWSIRTVDADALSTIRLYIYTDCRLGDLLRDHLRGIPAAEGVQPRECALRLHQVQEDLPAEEDSRAPSAVRLRPGALFHLPALLQAVQAWLHSAEAYAQHSRCVYSEIAPQESKGRRQHLDCSIGRRPNCGLSVFKRDF
ncbi:hypothetical protein D910_06824 [Dendroctonus ponderosae]|uniref:C2H2-type domain-containing protein n=1 Tax=Dendroctonus ponderosae TaxID=77166 RepID=U4U8T4_DENPD|nr:hypothetical protein D910_06824 [Dendroctonus ponderosae]